MSQWSLSSEDKNRERFWRTKPKDPTRAFAQSGTPYYRPGKQRVLMPDDFIPIGPHAGKHLRAVPHDYLLWVNAQPWSRYWPHWQPIADYISRFLLDASDSEFVVHASACPASAPPAPNTPLFYLSPQNRFYTLPGHEDLLQTLAEAVLHTRPADYQTGAPPHYQLNNRQFLTVQRFPHVQKTDTPTTQTHRDLWIQFFQSRPKLPQ
jgi:hypothetical protein